MLQPQTAAEHREDFDSSSSSSSSSESSSSSSSESDETSDSDDVQLESQANRRRMSRSGSMQSLHLSSIFHSKKRKRNPLKTCDVEVGKSGNLFDFLDLAKYNESYTIPISISFCIISGFLSYVF